MHSAPRALVVLLLLLPACPERQEESAPAQPAAEDPPPRPRVDETFVKRAFNTDALPANEALVLEMDPAPGLEAVVVVDLGNRNYQLAVVRGNHKVLSRAPLGGKILAHTNVQHIGQFRRLNAEGGGRAELMLPVAALVRRQWVCGVLIFGYRAESLVLVGEMGSRCWNRAAVEKKAIDPYILVEVTGEGGDLRLAVTEERGVRTYAWDRVSGSYKPVKFEERP